MKRPRIQLLLALALVCALLFSVPAGAETLETGASDFLYEENEDGSLTLTAYTGDAEQPVIPDEIDGKKVTEIGDSCFAGLLTVKKVRVPEGIVRIGDYAFECCGCLNKIYLPDSLESIGEGAFSGCINLVLADMQEGIRTIGRGAFLTCTRLVYVELPASLTEVGEFAFSGCANLAQAVFHGDAVTVIPDRLFYGCERLQQVTLPQEITSIGKRAFEGCESLRSLYAAPLLAEIGTHAFGGCKALSSLDISAAVIGTEAFAGCEKMSYFNVSEGTERISYRAFMGSGVKDLYLPGSVTEIEEGAFADSSINSLSVDENPAYQMKDDRFLLTADGKTLLACFPEDPYAEEPAPELTVPEGVENIAGYAFTCVWGTERVILPDSVQKVSAHAFTNSSVMEAVIPDSAEVDPEAFLGSAMEEYEDPYEEEQAPEEDPDGSAEEAVPETGSIAGGRSLFDPEKYAGYLTITNDEFESWSEKYLDYYGRFYPLDPQLMPYIMMYKGEVIPHYVPMTYVQNHDPSMWDRALSRFGDDFEETYQVMNHGLFTELRRSKMCDDLVLYSGVYDSQLMAAAGTDTVPGLEQLADAIGNTFTDPVMISTTTDPAVACNFSDTLFVIYASREAMESLGAISIDSFIHTNEKEILMCEKAQYRILDVGVMAVESTDEMGEPETVYRNYLTVELLGAAAE